MSRSLRAGVVALACAIACLLGVANASTGQASQIGTGSSSDTSRNSLARTTMSEPALSNNYGSGGPDKFYWIGTRFDEGTFYQAGYRDAASDADCAGLEWFDAAFSATGVWLFYDKSQCGATGTRTFTLAFVYRNAQGTTFWQAKAGTAFIPTTQLATSSNYLPASTTGVISEVSGDEPFATLPGLARVEYSPAVELYRAAAWNNQTHAKMYRANYSPCPPYYLSALGVNAVRIFSSSNTANTCIPSGGVLW